MIARDWRQTANLRRTIATTLSGRIANVSVAVTVFRNIRAHGPRTRVSFLLDRRSPCVCASAVFQKYDRISMRCASTRYTMRRDNNKKTVMYCYSTHCTLYKTRIKTLRVASSMLSIMRFLCIHRMITFMRTYTMILKIRWLLVDHEMTLSTDVATTLARRALIRN